MNKLFFIIFLAFLSPLSAAAQNLYLSAPEKVKAGESFEVLVELGTGNILVNSASAVVDYDESVFSFAGYKSEETVLNLWVDAPHEKEGKIYFSGITPGGVSGAYDPTKSELQDLVLTRLLFTANAEGTGSFSFTDSKVLKHDGRGTEFAHTAVGTNVTVDGEVAPGEVTGDATKPLPFTLTYLDAGFFSRTPSMIMWEALDLESGIKEYKIKVGWGTWKTGESPYGVARGFFPKDVTVRALDYAGNSEEANISLPGLITFKVFGGLVILIFLCIAGFKMIK